MLGTGSRGGGEPYHFNSGRGIEGRKGPAHSKPLFNSRERSPLARPECSGGRSRIGSFFRRRLPAGSCRFPERPCAKPKKEKNPSQVRLRPALRDPSGRSLETVPGPEAGPRGNGVPLFLFASRQAQWLPRVSKSPENRQPRPSNLGAQYTAVEKDVKRKTQNAGAHLPKPSIPSGQVLQLRRLPIRS